MCVLARYYKNRLTVLGAFLLTDSWNVDVRYFAKDVDLTTSRSYCILHWQPEFYIFQFIFYNSNNLCAVFGLYEDNKLRTNKQLDGTNDNIQY